MAPSHRFAISAILTVASIVLAACNFPLGPAPDSAATATLESLATEVQATLVGVPTPIDQPTPPDQPTPADTPTPVASPTPVPTATIEPARAHVNENTNCRSGPGVVYDHVYTALAGSDLVIVGRSTVADYVIVQIPGELGTCWLWTRYVVVSGDLSSLPISTPPPTPTPGVQFDLSYGYIDSCVGWDPGFKVVNTGSATFRSSKIVVEDTVTSTDQEYINDRFDRTNGCIVQTSIPTLGPGDTGWVYAYSFLYDPTGHELEATVTLCTGPALGGTCVSRTITATP
jgi:hypothetical protein